MKSNNSYSLHTMRHSCEHVLHMAMENLYPGIKAAMGPATEEGFYFDFDHGKHKISEIDFPKIEKEMKNIVQQNIPITKKEINIKEGKSLFKNNSYKQEWLAEIQKKGTKPTLYYIGKDFVDLCSGPHIESTGKIGPFKLLAVAGAYWHGDEKNKMLTRIYGTCFASQKELDDYLKQQLEAEKRDHRVLGKKLELFIIDDEVGPGLPLWLPKGAFIRHKIMEFALNTYMDRGYQLVSTPHIASNDLWQHSGHLDFYKESMYGSFGVENKKYRLKPMNCPLQVKMYTARPRSYKELPIRWTEMGTVYRFEKTGVLHGLTRVRGFTQDDAHIICTPDQLHKELKSALEITLYLLKVFGFKDFEMNLSVRDPKEKKKFIGQGKDWDKAESALKKAMASLGYKNYVLDVGGAVFYGPKVDVKVADSLGRKWQLTTIQVDFNLPGRFKMNYIDKEGKQQTPFMIHRALLGSLERFIGVYIEHTAGAFPVWLAPTQAIIIPIAERHSKYASELKSKLSESSIRVDVDDRSESMQKKIREAEEQKIPYMIIVGDKEEKENTISIRQRGKKNLGKMKIEEFIQKIKKEIEEKTIF